jgi:Zn-finger protein
MGDVYFCQKCQGTGRMRNADGSIQTCMDCLLAGRLDSHTKDVKDSGIQI